MNRKRTTMVAVVAFACAAVSFFNARSTALSDQEDKHEPSQKWLTDASAAAIELEEQFDEQLNELMNALAARQKSLAAVLEDPSTPDVVVLKHTENVIAARENLVRRVGEHVVELRGKLPAANRDYLMSLCAETVRGPMCRLGGRGEGQGRRNGSGGGGRGGGGYGLGRGGGAGRGNGGGRGLRLRVGNRLAHRLRLNEEQVRVLGEKDPGFEADSLRLRDVLLAERAKLLSVFEDPQSSNEGLLQQLDRLISATSETERRITEHVLVLRPHLTVEQQKWLIGLCRRQCGSQGDLCEPVEPDNQ